MMARMLLVLLSVALTASMAGAGAPAYDVAVRINNAVGAPFTPLGDGTALTEFSEGAFYQPVYHVAN